ncbi:hypothetical protein PMAYCL1PPCAC_07905, partial [Pristionchus mayeri]
ALVLVQLCYTFHTAFTGLPVIWASIVLAHIACAIITRTKKRLRLHFKTFAALFTMEALSGIFSFLLYAHVFPRLEILCHIVISNYYLFKCILPMLYMV